MAETEAIKLVVIRDYMKSIATAQINRDGSLLSRFLLATEVTPGLI